MTTPKITFYALNGNAGGFTTIRLTIPAGYVEITEDPSGALQGLQGNLLDPFTGLPVLDNAGAEVWNPPSAAYPPGDYPIAIGDPRHEHGAQKSPLGNGGSGTYTDTRGNLTPGGAVQTLPAGPGYQTPSLGTPIARLRSNTATATRILVKEWA